MAFSKEFSKRELVSILETIEASTSCRTPSDLRDLLIRAKDLLDADYSICGLGKARNGSVRDATAVINGNYHPQWLDTYLADKLYTLDPVVRHHARFSSTGNWSDIFRRYENDPGSRVLRDAWDFGIRHGISSSVFIPERGEISIFSFSGRNDVFEDHHEKIVDVLILHLNNALLNVVRSISVESTEA